MPGADKAGKMCSNCSGDDLKPESFATFDVSSPDDAPSFAGNAGEKRKRYRTLRALAKFAKDALTLGIPRPRGKQRLNQIMANVHRGSFVNLNLNTFAAKKATSQSSVSSDDQPLEIRVSADAII